LTNQIPAIKTSDKLFLITYLRQNFLAMFRLMLLIVFIVVFGNAEAQTDSPFDLWAKSVNWDGTTHWTHYMLSQPDFQGPNSLPVPKIGNGSIDSSFYFSAATDFHFSKGDNTQNLFLAANVCLVKNVISFDINWVPFEHYDLDQATRERRHVFAAFYNDHVAAGDIHLNTNFQILNKLRDKIQLGFRIGYRFPTGTGFGAARTTDGPGYYFDFNFGKPLNNKSWKWIGMAGFYVWQMVSDKHRQDDAFLFGSGLEYNKNKWKGQAYLAGYLGYVQHSGDKPLVARLNIEKKCKNNNILFGLQQGLHDFHYFTISAGFKVRFAQ
jgi:hypothetical protein